MQIKKPVVLMILDGFGYSENKKYNAILTANTPQWDEWWQTQPHILIDASGEAAGLPAGQMGNSEVGHMHIGAGRVIYQDFTRINEAIRSSQFDSNPLLHTLIEESNHSGKTLHVMGLFSPGGVHSHEAHLFAFIKLCFKLKLTNKLALHLFLDGRDTPPQSAIKSIETLNQLLTDYPVATLCSITGRYYAMDRDQRWERVAPVYQLLTEAQSKEHFASATQAIEFYYSQGITDEFIPPTIIGQGCPVREGDSILFTNFRSDRARQLTKAFIDPDFSGFTQTKHPKLKRFATFTNYAKDLLTDSVFPPLSLTNTLGEIIAENHLNQLRIAETEKYPHVTFFFNGGSEQVFPHEDRILIPSPKVATYDLQPEMSAPELTNQLISAINENHYDLIICNYANADMVGHSGNFEATVKAIECLDHCMSQVWKAIQKAGGVLLITADHGNAEEMFDDKTQQPHTAHTSDPVPLLLVGSNWTFNTDKGSLIDIAPTILAILSIPKPSEMTGKCLLDEINV